MQEGASYVVALSQADGSVAWKVDRTFKVQKESGQAYTTPYLTEIDGEETLVIWGADHLTGHDPATGEQQWICGGFNPQDQPMWRVIASPAFTNGIAVVPYGRTNFLAGVKMGGRWGRYRVGSLVDSQGRRCGLSNSDWVGRQSLLAQRSRKTKLHQRRNRRRPLDFRSTSRPRKVLLVSNPRGRFTALRSRRRRGDDGQNSRRRHGVAVGERHGSTHRRITRPAQRQDSHPRRERLVLHRKLEPNCRKNG